MKTLCTSLLLTFLITTLSQGQNFTELAQNPQIASVYNSGVAFGDVDNDGDKDLFVTGFNGQDNPHYSVLYLNDGNGNFAEDTDNFFIPMTNSSAVFADIDGDDDLDLLVAGFNPNSVNQTLLYLNDGSGSFSILGNIGLQDVSFAALAFADIDGDNDLDLFLSGNTSAPDFVSLIYTNDGSGNFTENSSSELSVLSDGVAEFFDANGDGSQDLFISGRSGVIYVSELYLNDGTGQFNLAPNNTFEAVDFNSAAIADIDQDGDLDIVISGRNPSNEILTKFYVNDGNGQYSEFSGNSDIIEVIGGQLAFADIDNDGDQDLFVSGDQDFNGTRLAKLYANDGHGNFTELLNTPFPGLAFGSLAFEDVNNDGWVDLFITGQTGANALEPSYQRFSSLYLNSEVLTTDHIIQVASKVYPNPTLDGYIRINMSHEISSEAYIALYNVNGQCVHNDRVMINKAEIALDVSFLEKGIYTLQILWDGYRSNSKFIISR